MLIYNYSKEFIGIDENDLKFFGFSNLSDLQSEAADFADFFVRTPGYVHNFKHVHWIDFITCAESAEDSRVIISVNSKTYTAKLVISTVFLADYPSSKGYLVNLNGLRVLDAKESENISQDLQRRPIPQTSVPMASSFATPSASVATPPKEVKIPESKDEQYSLDVDFSDEELFLAPTEHVTTHKEVPVEVHETFADEKIDFNAVDLPPVKVATKVEEFSSKEEQDFDNSYTFDPHVASDELGLPVDLIEEFIQDFIAQAKEFKDELYSSLAKENIENVKILSHKLKGVAANLRVEDAFNTLSVVNTSLDLQEIRSHLNIFYRIIAKLSGEEVKIVQEIQEIEKVQEALEVKEAQEAQIVDEYDFSLDFKDDVFEVEPKIETKTEVEVETEPDFELELKVDDVYSTPELKTKVEEEALSTDSIMDDDYFAPDVDFEEISKESLVDVDIAEQEEIKIEELIEEEPEEEIKVDYSKTSIANAIGLDLETFEELFEDYILDCRSISSNIHEALAQNNFEKCKKEAFVLKGMSDSMHMKSFKSEVESLMTSSDKNEMTKAIRTIDLVIKQISNKA